jgi:SAM-dependent methyltransferase
LTPLDELLGAPPEGVITEISPGDPVYSSERHDAYFRWGESAVACIRLALLAAERDDPSSVLDFACGHGRVLRTLKAAFPDAKLTACDIDRDGVDFCARTFGAEPAYSSANPEEIAIEGRFELIWVGSMFTHLDAGRWVGFLRLFESLLEAGGMLVFTTGGRFVVEKMKAGKQSVGIREAQSRQLIADFERTGFGYQEYRRRPGWGLARAAPAWVCARLDEVPELRLVSYVERGWLSSQDVVSCLRQPLADELREPLADETLR